jgi:hypothetical protein
VRICLQTGLTLIASFIAICGELTERLRSELLSNGVANKLVEAPLSGNLGEACGEKRDPQRTRPMIEDESFLLKRGLVRARSILFLGGLNDL